MEDLKTHSRQHLLKRAKRLVRLLELNAPEIIIADEVLLVYESGVGFCQDSFGERLMEHMVEGLRLKMGYCLEHDCDNRVSDSSKYYCELHATQKE